MLRRLLLAALAAGLAAGLAVSVVQEFTTTPLILQAESFETGATAAAAGAWGERLERTAFTVVANVVMGIGFALLLVACFALRGKEVDGRSGLLWGLGGYAAVSLGPALGLPPVVPGTMVAELMARQEWWLLAAAATAAGLALMVFARHLAWIVAGAVIIALPHFAGAPRPEEIGGDIAPQLAGRFVAASLVTAALFWSILGWFAGTFYRRLS